MFFLVKLIKISKLDLIKICNMIDNLHFEFGEIRVFKNFVVAVMNEGVTVIPEYNQELLKISEKFFHNRPFGYITYRKNSYAVNPLVYLKTSTIENLVAFAVVSTHEISISNLEVEKRFLTKPLKHFTDLDEAKDWVNKMVAEAEKK